MGRSTGPVASLLRRSTGPAMAALCLIASLGLTTPAVTQTFNEQLAQKTAGTGGGKDRLLVQAQEMVYDRTKNTVGARGNVQLYYQGRILQADRVIYDRDKNRVFAEGHAKLTERDGTVAYGERFDLTDNFKDGFIDSLRADTADKTHFTAARAERTGGDVTVMERGYPTSLRFQHPVGPALQSPRCKSGLASSADASVANAHIAPLHPASQAADPPATYPP